MSKEFLKDVFKQLDFLDLSKELSIFTDKEQYSAKGEAGLITDTKNYSLKGEAGLIVDKEQYSAKGEVGLITDKENYKVKGETVDFIKAQSGLKNEVKGVAEYDYLMKKKELGVVASRLSFDKELELLTGGKK